jgi:multidrug efflux pump subunit AcrA (membrane-fusion protein)
MTVIDQELAPTPSGWRRWAVRIVVLIVVLAAIGAIVYAAAQSFRPSGETEDTSVRTHTVAPMDLLISVTEDGNVESGSNVDLKCQVAGGSSILSIVKDGKEVKQDDKLVVLDSSQIEDQINQQKITFEKARSAMIQAEKDYQVAQIAVKEYLEGIYKKDLQDADAQITISLENLRTAQNVLDYSQRMFRKGYIGALELESQEFAVQRAQLELDSARTAKDVLVNFTRLKMVEELESQQETARAKMESEKAAFALEQSRLERLEKQLDNCVIIAPQDGMVVYANEMGSRFRGNQSVTIEEGAMVRERQTILRLPDLAQMQVKVNVHESKVKQIKPGMRARVRILDRDMGGTVTAVASQPESTSFFQASVKEYGTTVRIDGQPEELLPGMTAEVEILVADLEGVLALPVSTVVERRGKFYCWVEKAPKDTERRQLKLGLSNDKFVEVLDGVAAGEKVIRNPRAVMGDDFLAEDEADEEAESKQAAESESTTTPRDRRQETGPPGGPGRPPGIPGGEGPPGPRPEGRGPGGGGDRPDGAGPGRGPGGGGPGGRPNLMQFDVDGDGRVSKEEAPERMQQFFDRIDSNGDGAIDQAEIDQMQSRFGGGPAAGRGPGGPSP